VLVPSCNHLLLLCSNSPLGCVDIKVTVVKVGCIELIIIDLVVEFRCATVLWPAPTRAALRATTSRELLFFLSAAGRRDRLGYTVWVECLQRVVFRFG
jgi:hypothetical protein